MRKRPSSCWRWRPRCRCRANAQDIALTLGDGDGFTRIQQVEAVSRFQNTLVRYILRIRTLTKAVAEAYYASREALGFPMCNKNK
jgi:glycyl-tRNA synthetase alpha subunit